MRPWLGLLAVVSSACGDDVLPPARIVMDVGHETDAWQLSPSPVRVDVDRVDADGTRTTHTTLAVGDEAFAIGRDGLFAYDVRGIDADGITRVRGRSLLIHEPSVAGSELPLFVARTRRWSRPPGTLVRAPGAQTRAALVGGRSVLVVDAEAEGRFSFERYDVGAWAAVPRRVAVDCPQAPCRVTALAATTGSIVLAVADTWAIWVDLADGRSGEAPRPDGLTSYGELAEGQSVSAADGSAYLVGATHPTRPSSAILHIAPNGTLALARLTVARRDAAATWVAGSGLVVLGGSNEGPALELLPPGSTMALPLAYAPEPVFGAGAASTAGGGVVRAGGVDAAGKPASTVSFSLGCGSACTPAPAGPVVPLTAARAFAANTETLIVGRSELAHTAAYLLSEKSLEAMPLRQPRSGAVAVAIPAIEEIAIVGGVLDDGSIADTLEFFVH